MYINARKRAKVLINDSKGGQMSKFEDELMKAIDNDQIEGKIKNMVREQFSWKDGIIFGICILIFVGVTIEMALAASTSRQVFNGVFAQGQVLISAFLVSKYFKKGFITAVVLNFLQMMSVLMSLIHDFSNSKIPGVMVPLGAIVICIVLYLYNKRLRMSLSYVNNQRQELIGLSEEIAQMNDELEESNQELVTKNKLILQGQEVLEHTAYYDDLTSLPNRKMIMKILDEHIKKADQVGGSFGIAMINLDNFKRINEMLGHGFGDEFLKIVTRRLRKSTFEKDFVGRIGGDEFALIGAWDYSEEKCCEDMQRIKEQVCKVASVNGAKISIDFTVGIVRYPDCGTTAEELFKNVTIALHYAKDMKQGSVCIFDKKMQKEFKDKLVLESILKNAVEEKQFHLVYQPQFNAKDKKVRGVEALLRLKTPAGNDIGPATFIPVIEQMGLMPELGVWILEQAFDMRIRAKENYDDDFVISINISVLQLMQTDFLDIVRGLIEKYNIDTKCLEFEITESVLITSPEQAAEIVATLKEWGVRISLDDFGTGYSLLSHLTDLPIDTLKIDKSFVDAVLEENEKRHVIDTIMSLAHNMGMSIVAEGVELEEQLEYLRERQCDYIQGYLWSKPVTEQDFFKIMSE